MKNLFKKWRALPDSTKSSAAFMLSSFLITGLNFVTTPIFTRLMDKVQYGMVATYNSWLFIIDVFALLGLTSAGVFNVGLNEHRDGARSKYISSILTLCNITTIAVFGALFGAKLLFGEDFILPLNLLVLMFIHFIFSPANIFWITREKYEYRYKLSTLITVISSLLSQTVSLLFVLYTTSESTSSVKLWSTELTLLLFYVPIYFYILMKGKSFFNLKLWKQTLVFALPLIPHYLAQHIMTSADMIMITEIIGEADSAIYSVVSNIGKVATIAWSAINVTLIAISFEAFDKRDYVSLRKTVTALIIAYGTLCLGVCLLAPEILAILAPADYAHGVYAVPPIACVAFICGLYNIYGNVEFYHKRAFSIALATVVSAIFNVALNALLIPFIGFVGAAYATLASYAVLILMHYIGYKRCSEDEIYNNKTILIISVAIMAACLLTSLIYFNNIVRYAIIGAMLLLALIKRKSIQTKIKLLFNK